MRVPDRICNAIITTFAAALLVLGVSISPASAADKSHRSSAQASLASDAGTCTVANRQALNIGLVSLGSSAPPYDYRVAGMAQVSNPSAAAGCILVVCEAEELGAGNWVPAWCSRNAVSPSDSIYESYWPYVDCQGYDGTGYFRSYVTFEGSGVAALGPPRFVCT